MSAFLGPRGQHVAGSGCDRSRQALFELCVVTRPGVDDEGGIFGAALAVGPGLDAGDLQKGCAAAKRGYLEDATGEDRCAAVRCSVAVGDAVGSCADPQSAFEDDRLDRMAAVGGFSRKLRPLGPVDDDLDREIGFTVEMLEDGVSSFSVQ